MQGRHAESCVHRVIKLSSHTKSSNTVCVGDVLDGGIECWKVVDGGNCLTSKSWENTLLKHPSRIHQSSNRVTLSHPPNSPQTLKPYFDRQTVHSPIRSKNLKTWCAWWWYGDGDECVARSCLVKIKKKNLRRYRQTVLENNNKHSTEATTEKRRREGERSPVSI